MLNLSLEEAQLMRLLTGFFGRERVIHRVSVLSVCGGRLSPDLEYSRLGMDAAELEHWARVNSCLFTIIDDDARPCLVIEFGAPGGGVIDVEQLEHGRYLAPILACERIHYVTVSPQEFAEIMDPDASLDMFSFLRDKIEGAGD